MSNYSVSDLQSKTTEELIDMYLDAQYDLEMERKKVSLLRVGLAKIINCFETVPADAFSAFKKGREALEYCLKN